MPSKHQVTGSSPVVYAIQKHMSKKLSGTTKGTSPRQSKTTRLAGGAGKLAANQDSEALLRRCVLACLLWEDLAYETGSQNSDNIAALIPQVEPRIVADICIESRQKQKLRHVPLYIAREMARYPAYNKYLDEVLPKVITRADQLTDFVALYYDKKGSRQGNTNAKLTNKVKKGLALAFNNFQEYHFAKYNRDGLVRLRDVMNLVHPKPLTEERSALYKQIQEGTLASPLTWEVELSAGKDKKETFTKLIEDNKIGGLAFLRNLRNIEQSGVVASTVIKGFNRLHKSMLLPLNFISAHKYTTKYADEVEQAMLASFALREKLPGHTVIILDVSGSMMAGISGRSELNRIDAGVSLMMLAREACERVTLFVTGTTTHQMKNVRGFALAKEVERLRSHAGGGGIYTSRCLKETQATIGADTADRVIVFSDSQDCGRGDKPTKPYGKTNYIVDISAHKHGVNYKGDWTAEVSGWSENFLEYIFAAEGLTLAETDG